MVLVKKYFALGQNCRMRNMFFALLCFSAFSACAEHGYAIWGTLKYPPGFAHFDYVNPQAPKGGELRLVSNQRMSTFDKYNPFTIKGSAPAYLSNLVFDSLLISSLDELGSAYGLLAQDVHVAPDRLSVTFRLHPAARFHNGDAVLALDVKHSYDLLLGPFASPSYRSLLVDVAGVDVLSARTVRFRFKKPHRELPLTVGSLPVFSHRWGEENGVLKPFDKVVMDMPIGSGPYKIGPVSFGKDITYVRDPHYWAQAISVRRGTANFDRISIKIYRDSTARLEALKAGEFDLVRFFSSGDWARRVTGKKLDSGELVKKEFRHRLPSGFQSYVLNIRRDKLKDVRVRQALGLALDYEWMNQHLFYGAYQRVQGLFGNTDCQASGMPQVGELKLLEPWRTHIPAASFGPMAVPPKTDGSSSLRANLRQAKALLEAAGWHYRDGALRNARNEVFELEYLDSSEASARVVSSWARNLEKLGVRLVLRSVDYALYQQRLQKFDFDVTSLAYQGSRYPGQELADLFGSKAADQEDSGNHAGIKNPAVDMLIERMVSAKNQNELLYACRALDRVLAHSHIFIPQWFASAYRMVYNAWRLNMPPDMPPYAQSEIWAIDTWWAK